MATRKCQWHDCPTMIDVGPEPVSLMGIRNPGGKGLVLMDSDGDAVRFLVVWCSRHVQDYENKKDAIVREWDEGLAV